MNCANHADASAVAYCRTCGKALCANCTRPVKGVIYCEECLGAKMEGKTPPAAAAFVPGVPAGTAVYAPAAAASSGPNPALAGILAGFFPFGVGAVYTGQYAKGLAHLIIVALTFAIAQSTNGGIQGFAILALCFFYVYQIIDAVRSARAIQAGQPAPDPFGLAQTFSAGQKVDTSKVPVGAVVLILIGAFFLLHTAGLFDVDFSHLWPLIPILLGAWILRGRWMLSNSAHGCGCERCRAQSLMGPAILIVFGVVAMIGSFRHVGLLGYVGAILLVVGGVKVFRDGASMEGHRTFPGPAVPPSGDAVPPPPVPPAPPSEVSHG